MFTIRMGEYLKEFPIYFNGNITQNFNNRLQKVENLAKLKAFGISNQYLTKIDRIEVKIKSTLNSEKKIDINSKNFSKKVYCLLKPIYVLNILFIRIYTL